MMARKDYLNGISANGHAKSPCTCCGHEHEHEHESKIMKSISFLIALGIGVILLMIVLWAAIVVSKEVWGLLHG
jgi:uncharacterized protein (DUF983 family)